MPGLDPGIYAVTFRQVEGANGMDCRLKPGNSPTRGALKGTMPRFTVQKGKRYRAKISLGLLQSVASNDMVADKFREVGFTNVTVTGSGRTRHAQGLWPHDDAAAEIPSEISQIEQIEV